MVCENIEITSMHRRNVGDMKKTSHKCTDKSLGDQPVCIDKMDIVFSNNS